MLLAEPLLLPPRSQSVCLPEGFLQSFLSAGLFKAALWLGSVRCQSPPSNLKAPWKAICDRVMQVPHCAHCTDLTCFLRGDLALSEHLEV